MLLIALSDEGESTTALRRLPSCCCSFKQLCRPGGPWVSKSRDAERRPGSSKWRREAECSSLERCTYHWEAQREDCLIGLSRFSENLFFFLVLLLAEFPTPKLVPKQWKPSKMKTNDEERWIGHGSKRTILTKPYKNHRFWETLFLSVMFFGVPSWLTTIGRKNTPARRARSKEAELGTAKEDMTWKSEFLGDKQRPVFFLFFFFDFWQFWALLL